MSSEDRRGTDDRGLALLLLVLGVVRVTIAAVQREVFATEATVALLMVVLALGMFAKTGDR